MTTPRGYCGCGCGEPVARQYKPGHDARHKSALVAALTGDTVTTRVRAATVLLDRGWGGFADPAALRNVPWTDARGRTLPHVAKVATWQVDHLGVHHAHRGCTALTRNARKVGGTNAITRLASDRYVTLVANTPERTAHLMRSWDQCPTCSVTENRLTYSERQAIHKEDTWQGDRPTPKNPPLVWDVEMDDDTGRLIHVTRNLLTGRITRTTPTTPAPWAAPNPTARVA